LTFAGRGCLNCASTFDSRAAGHELRYRKHRCRCESGEVPDMTPTRCENGYNGTVKIPYSRVSSGSKQRKKC